MSNLKNFQALLCENGFDAAIITDQLNQHYLSGFEFHDGVVLVLQKDAYLITDFRYVEAAKEKVVLHQKTSKNMLNYLLNS